MTTRSWTPLTDDELNAQIRAARKATRLADMKLASPRPLRSGLKVDKVRSQLSTQPLPLAESLARFHAAWKAGRGG